MVMATCSFSHFKPNKFSGREDITLSHFVFLIPDRDFRAIQDIGDAVVAPPGCFFSCFTSCVGTPTLSLYLNSLRKLDCVLFMLQVKHKSVLLAGIWLGSSQLLGEMSQLS